MRRVFLSVAALALLLISHFPAVAQVTRARFVEPLPAGSFGHQVKVSYETTTIDVPMPRLKIKQTGLLTSRLTEKDLERWKTLERLVFAKGKTGEPLHPVLQELWRWADGSGHIIYVELVDSKNVQTSTAGSFNIERFDPTGQRHVTVLKLFLSSIDLAVVGPQVARPGGFIPFEELSKEERYAEVLGHELAHVKYVLNNGVRTHLVHELIETTNDILLLHARKKPGALTSPEMKQRLTQRDELLKELEFQAEAVEEVVWRELLASKKSRAELASAAALNRRK
jgi:hypothetical protein